ncbi:MAG TPA: hypothetical protein VFS58_13455 [Steroidobacteraceae bacterium]|nr:hypothetical protein [Steroidobacteraceae bacterium]
MSAPGIASAKAKTSRIEITGPGLSRPLEIIAPEIVSEFNIWNGPGVRVNGESVHLDPAHQRGHFIDWPRGAVNKQAAGLQRFIVTFHLDAARAPNENGSRYVVFYEFDRSKPGGYIYLPLPQDTRPHHNSAIGHGVEGTWFHSTATWEAHIRASILQRQSAPDTASAM